MLIIAVAISMAGCTRTVEKSVVSHDTVYVAHNISDSTAIDHSAHENDFVSKRDTIIRIVCDTVVRADIRHDTLMVRDSVYVREKGDSVYIYKERIRDRILAAHDTLWRTRTDTVRDIIRDTVIQTRTDTLRVIHFVERGDSAYHAVDSDKMTVMERRTFGWLKLLAGVLLIFAGISVWLRLRKPTH